MANDNVENLIAALTATALDFAANKLGSKSNLAGKAEAALGNLEALAGKDGVPEEIIDALEELHESFGAAEPPSKDEIADTLHQIAKLLEPEAEMAEGDDQLDLGDEDSDNDLGLGVDAPSNEDGDYDHVIGSQEAVDYVDGLPDKDDEDELDLGDDPSDLDPDDDGDEDELDLGLGDDDDDEEVNETPESEIDIDELVEEASAEALASLDDDEDLSSEEEMQDLVSDEVGDEPEEVDDEDTDDEPTERQTLPGFGEGETPSIDQITAVADAIAKVTGDEPEPAEDLVSVDELFNSTPVETAPAALQLTPRPAGPVVQPAPTPEPAEEPEPEKAEDPKLVDEPVAPQVIPPVMPPLAPPTPKVVEPEHVDMDEDEPEASSPGLVARSWRWMAGCLMFALVALIVILMILIVGICGWQWFSSSAPTPAPAPPTKVVVPAPVVEEPGETLLDDEPEPIAVPTAIRAKGVGATLIDSTDEDGKPIRVLRVVSRGWSNGAPTDATYQWRIEGVNASEHGDWAVDESGAMVPFSCLDPKGEAESCPKVECLFRLSGDGPDCQE